MQPSWPPHSPPDPAEPEGRSKQLVVIALLLTVVAGLTATVGAVLITRGGDDQADTDFVATSAPVAPPVFEPRDSEGDGAFFPLEVQLAAFESEVIESAGMDPDDPAAASMRVSDDDVKSGLYGGTAENTCDPERLIDYLYDHPDKGEAWARVQGIEFNQLGSYIRSLDVRVLAAETVVLNHGFDPRTGAAYEIETTLEAGTAVLVDGNGEIRTRCYCGNPVKPKPPVHRAPRCLALTTLVFTTPGGSRRDGASSDVEATGQTATSQGAEWTEIAWGSTETAQGWTPTSNLRVGYCPTPVDVGAPCAAVGAPVYAQSSGSEVVGRLGGQVRTADTTTAVAGLASRVGGETGALIENGRVLIDFARSAPSDAASAWVNVDDLETQSCMPVTVCVDTEGPVRERPGGPTSRDSGVHLVAFTGHFGPEPVSHAEVSFVDGGGIGWISNFYSPVPESLCDVPPGRPECVPFTTEVWPTATEQDYERLVGRVNRATISVLDPAPSNGRVEIRMGPGGPSGWIAADSFGPTTLCRPIHVCTDVFVPVYPIHATSGSPIAGTPGESLDVAVYEIVTASVDSGPVYVSVGIDGQRGWVPDDGLAPPEEEAPCRDRGAERGDVCSSADGPHLVFTTPTSEGNDVVARVDDARLTVVDAATTNDRIQVQAGPNGPIGWIDEAVVTDFAGQCRPGPVVCLSTSTGYDAPHSSASAVDIPGGSSAAYPWRIAATTVPGPFIEDLSWQLFEVDAVDRDLWFEMSTLVVESTVDGCDDVPSPGQGSVVCARSVAGVFAEPTDAISRQIAEVNGSRVELLTSTPTDGFLPVRLTPSGPTGWMAAPTLSDDVAGCPEVLECIRYELPVYTVPDRSSFELEEGRIPPLAVDTGIRIFSAPGVSNDADLRYYTIATGWHFAGVDSFADGPTCEEPDSPPPPPSASPGPSPSPTPEPSPSPEPEPDCPDADGDGICNAPDNCRDDPNPDQADVDDDGVGDACDPCTDVDKDLHCAETDDTCPDDYDPTLQDTDRDGVGDVCDSCPTNPRITTGGPCVTEVTDCQPASYRGLSRSDGERFAQQNNCTYRITRIDDMEFAVTFDFVPDRLNWQIDNGIITSVTLG